MTAVSSLDRMSSHDFTPLRVSRNVTRLVAGDPNSVLNCKV